MSTTKQIGQFVGVALPSLFMLLWTVDAALVAGADVFLLALIQVGFIAVFMWRWHSPPAE